MLKKVSLGVFVIVAGLAVMSLAWATTPKCNANDVVESNYSPYQDYTLVRVIYDSKIVMIS